MNLAVVVVHEVKRDHVAVILKLFRVGVCQPRESAHSHSHRKILALNVAGADVLSFGSARNVVALAPDTRGRAVASRAGSGGAVDFDELRVVHVAAERVLYGFQIRLESV